MKQQEIKQTQRKKQVPTKIFLSNVSWNIWHTEMCNQCQLNQMQQKVTAQCSPQLTWNKNSKWQGLRHLPLLLRRAMGPRPNQSGVTALAAVNSNAKPNIGDAFGTIHLIIEIGWTVRTYIFISISRMICYDASGLWRSWAAHVTFRAFSAPHAHRRALSLSCFSLFSCMCFSWRQSSLVPRPSATGSRLQLLVEIKDLFFLATILLWQLAANATWALTWCPLLPLQYINA